MIAKPIKLEENTVFRRLPAKVALIAGLAPALFPVAAYAQVNIDAGKTPAEIYSSDCATCHKTPRGLANGKNSAALSAFLREHYTASRDQAAALAAYVLGAGGAEPAPKQKPDVEHARAEEPKSGEPKAGEAKPGEPKTGARAVRAAKPEEKRPKEQEAKQEQHSAPAAAEEHAPPETASREQKHEPEQAAPVKNEMPVTAETPGSIPTATARGGSPTRSELPSLELGSSLTAVPPAEEPSASATVPRDKIPD